MQIRRLGYALGAEITGLDLTRPLDEKTIAGLRQAWFEHIVLCFPGQNLTPEQQTSFCSNFCELDDSSSKPDDTNYNRPDSTTIQVLTSQPIVVLDKRIRPVLANEWHSDACYCDRPTSGSFLNAKALPDIGGDTLFANMYMAYETLSPAYKETIDSLGAVHDASVAVDFKRQSPEVQAERKRRYPPIVHPVVRIHPETGRRALYVGHRIRKFVGMTESETKPLLDFLNRHATRYEFIYRHRWTVHDLIMWDNRCTLHFAVQDYDPGQLRLMQRCEGRVPKEGTLYVEDAVTTGNAVPVSTAS